MMILVMTMSFFIVITRSECNGNEMRHMKILYV